MIDVDFCKSINDTYGHSAGDSALIDVAGILSRSKPDKSIVIRYAGDEFMLIVYDTSSQDLNYAMDRIHREVDKFNKAGSRPYTLSLSLGCSFFDQGNDTLDSFFKRMDNRMYENKEKVHSDDAQ